MHPSTPERKVEVQNDHKFHYFRCTTKKHFNEMSRLCITQAFTKNPSVKSFLSNNKYKLRQQIRQDETLQQRNE